jgi:hypothetical protein
MPDGYYIWLWVVLLASCGLSYIAGVVLTKGFIKLGVWVWVRWLG